MRERTRGACRTAWLMAAALCFLSAPASWAQTTRVAQVDVTGTEHINKEVILAAISTKPGDELSQAKLEADTNAIRALGWFKAVAGPRVEDTPAGKKVTFVVSEYPIVQKIQFTGNKAIDTDTLRKSIATQEGKVLNLNILNADVLKIQDLYKAKGYVGQVTSDLAANFETTGILTIPIVELTVDAVKVTGNRKTKEYVVLRELELKPGKVYNVNDLQKDYRRLERLDIFEQIEPHVTPSEPGKASISWDLKEKRTGQVSVGLGYSASQQLVGRAELSESNFRGRGQAVNLLYEVGGFTGGSSVELGFFEPWLDKKRTSLSLDVYDKLVYRFSNSFQPVNTTGTERYNERRKGGAVTLSRPLSDAFRLALGLRHDDVNTNTQALLNFPAQNGQVTSTTTRGTLDTRDYAQNPTGGSYHTGSAELGHANVNEITTGLNNVQFLRSFKNFYGKYVVDLRHYFGMKPHKATQPAERQKEKIPVVAMRFMGAVSNGTLPFFEQFFLGGADTLRGYTEDRFWGTKMFLASTELRMPVAANLIGVLFFDYGDAWDPSSGLDIANFPQHKGLDPSYGVGAGIRVTTPIGPIRLDYGFGREGGHAHFSIGHSF